MQTKDSKSLSCPILNVDWAIVHVFEKISNFNLCFFFYFFPNFSLLGIISTTANKFWASVMPRTVASSIGQWSIGRQKISIGLFGRCSRMFWIIIASRSFTFVERRNGRLHYTTMCSTSTICDASGRTKCMWMWCQFRTIAVHTGNVFIFHFRSLYKLYFFTLICSCVVFLPILICNISVSCAYHFFFFFCVFFFVSKDANGNLTVLRSH